MGTERVVMGVAVYLPHQYGRLLATAQDAEKLNGTWEEWRAVYEETQRNLRSIGVEPIDVLIEMEAFEKYCAERGLVNTGGTRADYVAELLSQRAEVRGQKSEVRSQRSEGRGQRAESSERMESDE